MNHTPDHLNYNHPQPPSGTSGDQNQQNQQNYHQLASPITFDDDMLRMQTTSRPMHQFQFGGGNMYDTMYFTYPAPSPPAPATGPSLLNAQEFSTINGFLETITEGGFDQTGTTKYPQLDSLGWLAEEEPQFSQIPMGQQQHLQSYMGNSLAGNNVNTLDSSSSPNIHSNAVQSNSIPTTPSQPHHDSPVIVNPFTGHGLIPQPNSIHMPSNGVLNTLAWGSDPSFGNSGFHAALQPPTQQDLQRKVLAMMVPNSSGDTTANSLVEIKFERIGEDITGSDTGSNFTTGNTQSPTLSATQTAGVKRRAEDEDDDQQGQPRKSRPRKDSSAEATAKGKRGGKREHLSEAEKRQNHIQSEQKRRNQIKFGFDTLTELVPELRGGGYSKSAVLQHAAVYVENLVGGNAALRNILKNLEEKHNSGLSSGPDGSGHP